MDRIVICLRLTRQSSQPLRLEVRYLRRKMESIIRLSDVLRGTWLFSQDYKNIIETPQNTSIFFFHKKVVVGRSCAPSFVARKSSAFMSKSNDIESVCCVVEVEDLMKMQLHSMRSVLLFVLFAKKWTF